MHPLQKVAATLILLTNTAVSVAASCRLVYGVANLPLGSPAEIKLIFEVSK